MKLRAATIRDTDFVVDLIKAMLQDMVSYGGHALNEEGKIDLQLRTYFRDISKKENHIFLLAISEKTEKEPMGLIETSVISSSAIFQPKSILHIHSIYVEPGHRREGIGQSLLKAALEWGRGKGCAEPELSVLARNPANKFYEDAGFEVFESEMRLEL